MLTERLLPCPFCGSSAEFVLLDRSVYRHAVRCISEICGAVAGGSAFKNDEYNAALWNRRNKPVGVNNEY